MDNLKAHQVTGIREAIELAHATLRSLPSYSPDLSPIELGWSKVKTVLTPERHEPAGPWNLPGPMRWHVSRPVMLIVGLPTVATVQTQLKLARSETLNSDS